MLSGSFHYIQIRIIHYLMNFGCHDIRMFMPQVRNYKKNFIVNNISLNIRGPCYKWHWNVVIRRMITNRGHSSIGSHHDNQIFA